MPTRELTDDRRALKPADTFLDDAINERGIQFLALTNADGFIQFFCHINLPYAVQPPSITSVVPVVKAAASEAR